MKRVWLVTAALAAAVAVFAVATLPPARVVLDAAPADGTVPGVIHIHTSRSDGRGSPDEVAAAAAAAGLKFIVLTDHGDGTRAPDAPVYRHDVLCIDGVEISTTGGHYVAIGLPRASYPLGGEPRDVVEDVRRLGGFGIAAHPDSPKPELRWDAWRTPFDGMELMNLDSGWRKRVAAARVRPELRLAERLLSYPFRPAESIASVLADPADNLSRWDALTRSRKIVGVAGADAHARLALVSSEPGDNRFALPLPGYVASFRTLSVHVAPRRPLTGQADADARAIIDGLRAGHVYVAVDGLASPPSFSFTADGDDGAMQEGDEIVAPTGHLMLHVSSNAPAPFTTTIFDDGRAIASSQQRRLAIPANRAGVFRVEIRASDRPGNPPWILSNPIYVRAGGSESSAGSLPPSSQTLIFDGSNVHDWSLEHDASSNAQLTVDSTSGEGAMVFGYALSAGAAATRPYAALQRDMSDGLSGNRRITFVAHADGPMRVSVQLRTGIPGTPEERWQRSVYLDRTDRDVTVPFDEMSPIGGARSPRPSLEQIRYVLFVVDATNAKTGAEGTITFKRIALER